MPGKIVCIEGNIGAGKSTLLQRLEKKGFPVFQENLDAWGHLLDFFYRDPHRWSFALQTAVMLDSAKQYDHMKALLEQHEYVFVERSIDTCMVFAKMALLNKYLTEDEYKLLDDLYQKIRWEPDFRLYLDADVNTCMQRIRQRGRPCEQNITVDYLLSIQSCYESLRVDWRVNADLQEEILDAASKLFRTQSHQEVVEIMMGEIRQIIMNSRSTN